MPRLKNLIGMRYGRLVVVERAANTRHNQSRWLCRCDCGQEKVITGKNLGTCTGSCGCLHSERARTGDIRRTHGMRKTPEYGVWATMRRRCDDPNVKSYPRYGGRGIKVCDRWLDFDNFIADVGRRPSSKHSIERIDNNGNYEPSNCKWAIKMEQLYNKGNTLLLNYNGSKITVHDASQIAGISKRLIRRRLRDGWAVSRAIEVPPMPTSPTRP